MDDNQYRGLFGRAEEWLLQQQPVRKARGPARKARAPAIDEPAATVHDLPPYLRAAVLTVQLLRRISASSQTAG